MVTAQVSNEDLQKRIEALEDRNAIQEVTAQYCFATNGKNISDTLKIFHEKAELDVAPWGHFTGKEGLEKFFVGIWSIASDLQHLTHNHVIKINGDRATGICHFEATLTIGGKPLICAGIYDDNLVKEKGIWYIMKRIIKMDYLVPLNEGWASEKKICVSL